MGPSTFNRCLLATLLLGCAASALACRGQAAELAADAELDGAKGVEVANEVVAEQRALTLADIFARHANLQAVSGRFRDVVTQLDQPPGAEPAEPEEGVEALKVGVQKEQPTTYHVQFWLQRPLDYHFILQENDAEDRQHYLSDGVDRWQVEVVLDSPLVDRQPANADDPFARIQQLMQLQAEDLKKDFTWQDLLTLSEQWPVQMAAVTRPAAWHYGLWLEPRSPEMRSEVQHVLLAFAQNGALAGMVIDDHHGNRRLVQMEELNTHGQLDRKLFRWATE